jgi:stress-induced morphogen
MDQILQTVNINNYQMKLENKMRSSKNSSKSTASSSSSEEIDRRSHLKCRVCGQQFDDMAEMQRHTLTEHIQKGDLPT